MDELDDMKNRVRSKILRATLWLSADATVWTALAISLATAPAEHLMQSIQHLDARVDCSGGSQVFPQQQARSSSA